MRSWTSAQQRIEKLKQNILSRSPQTRATRIDHERLTARRIDIVDENGVIRMTLAAPTPAPIVDGIQYKRTFPVSELADAIGWRVSPDGGKVVEIFAPEAHRAAKP